jgi:hypothetical protein
MGPFLKHSFEGDNPVPPSVVLARGYAVHYLKNAVAFWGIAALLSFAAALTAAYTELWRGAAPNAVVLSAAAGVFAVSLYRGGRALWDLFDKPIPIAGKVSGKSASLFWNRIAFLEDKFHLRIVRGDDHRPLAYGTNFALSEGWFMAGRGYFEIFAEGHHVRGTAYRRTRVIDSLVKL